jgi:phage baseplate assembly protein W
MNNTTSWAWPNIFDVARNRVSIKTGNASITNRTKLLILTEPTELYNNPTFGVGLKQYLWQYNTPNTKAIIQDRIRNQLKEHEPCVASEKTQFADGLIFTEAGEEPKTISDNILKMTVSLATIFDDEISVTVNLEEEQAKIFRTEG